MSNIDNIENFDKESTYTFDEPHYPYNDEQQEEGFQEEIQLPIYSPQQLCLFKKQSQVHDIQDEFNLDQDLSRRSTYIQHKKVCINKNDPECSTVEHSESYPILYEQEGDLERLAQMLQKENQKKFSYPKNLPLPSQNSVEGHLNDLKMRFTPSQKQEEFIGQYMVQEDLLRVKIGLCEEILNDEETLKFEDWVEQLCTSTNHQSLKEMARKQKVKRYLEKKHNRTYEKKVHYHIRQKVAEERLRVKGRFVTWSQALRMLNESQESKKSWSYNDYFKIKTLLNEKFGAIKSEKSIIRGI